MKHLLIISALVLACGTGCSAKFTDLRPNTGDTTSSSDTANSTDTSASKDMASVADIGGSADTSAGADVSSQSDMTSTSDVMAGSDSNQTADTTAVTEKLIAQGDFKPGAYTVNGTAKLYQLSNGKYRLDLVNLGLPQVPDPGIVMTDRGPTIKKPEETQGDIYFGKVQPSDTFLSYTFDSANVPDDVVVLCVAFQIEMARATLEVVP